MKLADLHPGWVHCGGPDVHHADGSEVPRREQVGVAFDCPCGCDQRCFIPFANPPDGLGPIEPSEPGWNRTGDTFETLTLTPSILRVGGCGWHGFITGGEVRAA